MQLICDDVNNIYVWVEDDDENVELSPHFDYEEEKCVSIQNFSPKLRTIPKPLIVNITSF